MAQHILGLDLGAHAVKAVLLESTYRGYAVLGAASAPVPRAEGDDAPPLLARQAAAVHQLLEERGWRVDESVVAFPGSAVSSNVVTLPFTDARRIEQTIGFEVEGQIPFDLASVAWDWQPLGVRDGKTDLLVGVVRKEELGALLAALGHGGLDPRAVIPAGPAYAALLAGGAVAPLAAAPPEGPAPAEGVLDVGAERTSLCITVAGACEAARTFAFGGAHLVRALARALAIPEADAGALLAGELGGPPPPPELAARARDPRAAAALSAALQPLVREVRATVRAWQARVGPRRLERLSLAGELAALPGLPELLAADVDGPVVPLALAGPAAGAVPADRAPGLALALALALRGHQGARAPRLNLRRGELAYTRDFEHLKGKLARLGLYAAAILVLAVVSAGVKVFALSRQEASLDRALCDAEQKILGRCYPNFEEAQAILRGRGSAAAALPRVSAVDVLAELADKVPAEVPVRFDRIEITRDKLHLEGTTDGAESVDKVVEGLRGSRCFGDARSGSARKRASDGKFEFSIDSGLTCLESGPRDAGERG
ncbi:pilus assembly protein PilM [Anaeromyxobacter sp. PSR-1]|uniref:pilus assembly protein PilM n=1 Tax=Anaeromyxobacter sp. PSR-1 TaxID=1300915 RepID=UPI0005E12DB5|nr:pilus assembly protein PilM [Anaeromyxobacter sp. PSR-1]GAO02517.1 competence protein A [Anaeromyxobacter sp. PSR-1]